MHVCYTIFTLIMKIFNRKRTSILIAIVGILAVASYFVYFRSIFASPQHIAAGNLSQFTAESLRQYDGTDQELPIYIGLDGYVYDVTPGREWYAPGGTYHAIAGTDASRELHIFGAAIIKEKYTVIGTLIKSE